jgi:hypothetical protein
MGQALTFTHLLLTLDCFTFCVWGAATCFPQIVIIYLFDLSTGSFIFIVRNEYCKLFCKR